MNNLFRPLRGSVIIAAAMVCGAALAQAPAPGGAPPAGAPGAGSAAAVVRTIQEIKFTGNKKLSTEQLSKAIGIKVGDVNTKEAVGGAMDKIGEAYKKIGADLSYMVDISLPDATHTSINFIIDENGTGGNKGAAPRTGGPAGGMGAGGPPGGAPPAAPTK
ncbi:MAG: POTRA domain-containing protein [Steroidobacteraceae bacterium]